MVLHLKSVALCLGLFLMMQSQSACHLFIISTKFIVQCYGLNYNKQPTSIKVKIILDGDAEQV